MTGSFFPRGWPTESDWTSRLESFFQTPGFRALCEFVELQRAAHTIYPTEENVFRAFRLTPYQATKVVILGQDPYHGPGQAHGLSFSVEGETKLPPSLRNIYRELGDDIGCQPPTTGNLSAWARNGVFLLNTVLTVRQGEANSHQQQGWERFTDEIMRQLNLHAEPIVFLLWGKSAEKKATLIDTDRHTVISSAHPSPLSAHRGFWGSRPFSRANAALAASGRDHVDWAVQSTR